MVELRLRARHKKAAAIAIDLGCTNVAISELSVAMQQTIKATSPAATVLLEVAFTRKCHHPLIFALIGLLCVGSVLVKWGSSSYDATVYGMAMMILAVVAGAFKYVMAHSMINSFRKDLGVLAFTFWVEVLVALMLTCRRERRPEPSCALAARLRQASVRVSVPWQAVGGAQRRSRGAHLR